MRNSLFNNSIYFSLEIPIWMINNINISVRLMLDWISTLFIATVIFISRIILIFRLKYIPKNEFKQFSLILTCFVSSILILIIRDNIIFILLGWDGLGLSSYILVVYYQNFSSASSGIITILSNRLGDIAILLTIGILIMIINWNIIINEMFPKITLIFLVIAAISKRAQFPFSSWLPAAIAAPTPISALVHSSTLVTAGVYLLIRVINFTHPIVILLLIIISTATTIYARISANWEQDIKKIIALSTLRQIGIMIFAISIGVPNIAFFHLIIHALFKSIIFICAGILIHNFSYQDIRHMGIINFSSPLLSSIIIISRIALLGTPFISGFFSKDSILESLIRSKLLSILTIIILLSIGMTATYSFRIIKFSLKFSLKRKSDTLFQNEKIIEIPLIIIAPYSIFMGTTIIWLIFPTQIFFIPYNLKILIPLILVFGVLIGRIINFNSKSFVSIGQIPLTLWFLNFLSTLPTKFISSLIIIFQKNDKSWQETYGPQNFYFLIKLTTTPIDILLLKPSFIFIVIILSPIFLFII